MSFWKKKQSGKNIYIYIRVARLYKRATVEIFGVCLSFFLLLLLLPSNVDWVLILFTFCMRFQANFIVGRDNLTVRCSIQFLALKTNTILFHYNWIFVVILFFCFFSLFVFSNSIWNNQEQIKQTVHINILTGTARKKKHRQIIK